MLKLSKPANKEKPTTTTEQQQKEFFEGWKKSKFKRLRDYLNHLIFEENSK